nr:TetR/AcrR family transcriptional regulator [Rhizorhabdus dicambivorans]
MRSRPDEKRRAILDVATVLFRETGYERATMAEISARVGGSKATLYGYFKSKEELFVAAMIEALGEQSQVMLDLLDPSVPQVDRVLRRFGEAYLDFIMRPDVLAVTRAAVAEGAHVEVGALLYERGPSAAGRRCAPISRIYARRAPFARSILVSPPGISRACSRLASSSPCCSGPDRISDASRPSQARSSLFARLWRHRLGPGPLTCIGEEGIEEMGG